MYKLLRFSGALVDDPAVARWLDEQQGELGSIARKWFAQMRRCGADVRELMHDGCPVACVADAPFGYVNVFRAHANVGFFHGAALPDPAGILEGNGKYMRHVKMRPGVAADASALKAMIMAAYLDIGVRLRAPNCATQPTYPAAVWPDHAFRGDPRRRASRRVLRFPHPRG